MPGRDKDLITKNGMPIPQSYNPQTEDWESYIGVSWGKTAGGLYVPVAVTDEGHVKVQQSGTIVSAQSVGSMEVAAGAKVLVFEDDSGLFSKAMFLIYISAGPKAGKLFERYRVGGHSSVALEREIPLINRGGDRMLTEQPYPLLSPHAVRIYWENTTTETQTISRFVTWFYGR